MRLAILLASLSFVSAGAASAQTPDISGVWHIQGQISWNGATETERPTCTFQRNGGTLSGDCVGPAGRGPLSGIIAGDKVSWSWTHTATAPNGRTGTTNFNGTFVNPNLIQGEVTVPGVPVSGVFTQAR